MEDIGSKEIVDRLPVIVSSQGVDQLLGVPKLVAATGDTQLQQCMKQQCHGTFANKSRECVSTLLLSTVVL